MTSVSQLYDRADQALNLNRPKMAIDLILQAHGVDGVNAPTYSHIQLSRAYLALEGYEQAHRVLAKLLSTRPDYSTAHTMLGIVYRAQENFDQAMKAFEESLRLDPDNDMVHRLYGRLWLTHQKNNAQAFTHAQTALGLEPMDPDNLLFMGDVLAADNKLDEAEGFFNQALELSPNSTTVLNDYGVFLLNDRLDPKGAFPFFAEVMRQSPNNPTFRNNFFLTLKAKHPMVHRFWLIQMTIDKSGPFRLSIYVGAFMMFHFYRQWFKHDPHNPLLWMLSPLAILYVAFMIYAGYGDRLLSLMVKWRWIK